MGSNPNGEVGHRLSKLELGGASCALAVACIGAASLAAWLLGNGLGGRSGGAGSGYVPTSPDTALLFMVVGALAGLFVARRGKGRAAWIPTALLVLVSAYGAMKFVEYFLGLDLTFAGFLFPDSGNEGGYPTKRMSPVTGLLFLLGGGAMLVGRRESSSRALGDVAGGLGMLVSLSGFVAVLGYAFGAPLLYGGAIIPLAAPTACAFLLWGIAIAISVGPTGRLIGYLVGTSTGARLLRVVVPLVAFAILAGGLLSAKLGQGPIKDALLSALITLSTVAIAAGAVVWASRSILKAGDAAEGALRLSERKYRRLYDGLMDGYALVGMDGVVRESNPAFQSMVGYGPEELARLTYVDLTVAKWRDSEARILDEQVLRRGYSEVYEKEYMRKDGSVVPVELRSFLVRGEGGESEGIWAIVRNITERKRIEATLRESEERFRTIFENAGIGIALAALSGRLLKVNTAFVSMLGYGAEELLALEFVGITFPDDRSLDWQLHIDLAEGRRESFTIEKRYVRKDGSIIWGRLTASALRDSQGKTRFVIGMIEDISDRREQDERILKSLGEKEILLKEVHHRVKNNLQLVTSLLSLQTSSLPLGRDGDAVRSALVDAVGRVRSLADIHELVYLTEDFAGVDFGTYMRSIAQELVASLAQRPINLRLDLADVRMGLDDAIACGLIVNEAVTNLAKYAYPRDWEAERVAELSLGRTGDGSIRIVIRDRGVGLKDEAAAASGLGFGIMRILGDQIRGKLTLRSDAGLEVELVFPEQITGPVAGQGPAPGN